MKKGRKSIDPILYQNEGEAEINAHKAKLQELSKTEKINKKDRKILRKNIKDLENEIKG